MGTALSPLAAVNAGIEKALRRARRSLVEVRRRNGGGSGSGVVVHRDGLIVTNAHVVGRGDVEVVVKGTTLPARVLARDDALDLAAVWIQADGLEPVEIGSSRELLPGQWVISLGNPTAALGAAASGVVASVGRHPGLVGEGREWVVTDLPLRPGYSGGPMFDAEGRVVGINTMISGPDVGMAVPAATVKRFLKESLAAR